MFCDSSNLKFKSSEHGIDDIKYLMHLRNLNYLEHRNTQYPTYKIHFKSQQKPNKIDLIKKEIKNNRNLLNKNFKNYENFNMSEDFLNTYKQIKDMELKRLKIKNIQLKKLMNEMKHSKSCVDVNIKQNSKVNNFLVNNYYKYIIDNKIKKIPKNPIKKLHKLPYMRLANNFYNNINNSKLNK